MVAVAVAFSMALQGDAGQDRRDLAGELLAAFRSEVYRCLSRRGDALLELADAVLRRDRHCQWAGGCDQPASACEVHRTKLVV